MLSSEEIAPVHPDPDLLIEDTIKRFKSLNKPNHLFLQQLCEAVNTYEGAEKKPLWNKLITVCEAHQASVKNDPPLNLLCSAIIDYKNNLRIWPDIQTLDALLIAQQKREVLNEIYYEREKVSLKEKNAHLVLTQQIRNADIHTKAYDILGEDSLFLKAKNFIPENIIDPEERLKQEKLFRKANAIESDLNQVTLNKLREALLDNDPSLVLLERQQSYKKPFDPYVLAAEEEETNKAAQQNQGLYAALLTMREKYLRRKWRWFATHLKDIDRLIQEVEFILAQSDDHEKNNRLIISRLEAAYKKEEMHYRNAFKNRRTAADFEARLNCNDTEYSYPRLLREIIAPVYNPLLLDEATKINILMTKEPGEKIKKELFVKSNGQFLRINNLRVRLSNSIEIAENQSYFVMPGKGKEIIGKGAFGTVKKGAIKEKLREGRIKTSKHDWVKKSIKVGNLKRVIKESIAIRSCAPDLKPSWALTRNNKHTLFMRNAGKINLWQIIQSNKKLSNDIILSIFNDLLTQAMVAYQAGYIMYDIKPGNIVYDPIKKKATIVDHGSSKRIGDRGKIGNTPGYIPPNTSLGSDKWMTYQIGLVMVQLILRDTWNYSFGRIQKELTKKGLPAEFTNLIRSMIEPDEFERFGVQKALEVSNDICRVPDANLSPSKK